MSRQHTLSRRRASLKEAEPESKPEAPTAARPASESSSDRQGTVVDGTTGAPIAGAIVTAGDKIVRTDAQGQYKVAAGTEPIRSGSPATAARRSRSDASQPFKLTPLEPKALYLTVYGIGAPFLRRSGPRA